MFYTITTTDNDGNTHTETVPREHVPQYVERALRTYPNVTITAQVRQ